MSKKIFRVVVDGNIASGKSTFLNLIKKHDDNLKQIEIYPEPIDEWRNVNNFNLFESYCQNPEKFGYLFQQFIQLSLLKRSQIAESSMKKIKIFERSIHSSHHVFAEKLFQSGILKPEEYAVLNLWYEHLIKTEEYLNADLLIYLRNNPEINYKRLQKRDRFEEKTITYDYIEDLHRMYEQWLFGGKFKDHMSAQIMVIDGNQDFNIIENISKNIHKNLIIGHYECII